MLEQLSRRPRTSQYRLVLAICLFVVLDCSILGINFWITAQVEKDALAINIAGRQRMLSQRITKVLLLLETDVENRSAYRAELAEVYSLFNTTLTGFKQGGIVIDGEGQAQLFEAVDDGYVRKYILQSEQAMGGLAPSVEAIIGGDFTAGNIASAVSLAKEHNLTILALMNDLTTRMEQLSADKTASIRFVQTLAFLLALANFIVIIKLFLERSRQAETQVKNFLDLVDHAATCLIVLDDNMRIQLANRMSQELFGYTGNVINRLSFDELIHRRGKEWHGIRRDGSTFRVELIRRHFQLHEKRLTILTINDISHHADEQARLAHLANHDALTGLVNRRALFDRLELEIRHCRRSGKHLAAVFIDLDNFKPINDEYGHAVGDRVLAKVSERLRHLTRDTDTVARYGGDEFVIIYTELIDEAEVSRLLENIQTAFERPCKIKQHLIKIEPSVGLSIYPEDAGSATELIELADQRMYVSKKSSKQC